MYARITRFKMKTGSVDAAKALVDTLKPQIMALAGMKHFVNAIDADGNGYVVAVVESQEASDSNKDAVAAIWANFADHLEKPPVPEGFDVIANWSA